MLTFTPFPALASGMGSGEYFGGTNDKTLAVAAEARPKLLATTSPAPNVIASGARPSQSRDFWDAA